MTRNGCYRVPAVAKNLSDSAQLGPLSRPRTTNVFFDFVGYLEVVSENPGSCFSPSPMVYLGHRRSSRAHSIKSIM